MCDYFVVMYVKFFFFVKANSKKAPMIGFENLCHGQNGPYKEKCMHVVFYTIFVQCNVLKQIMSMDLLDYVLHP